jgi:hypothetical protein
MTGMAQLTVVIMFVVTWTLIGATVMGVYLNRAIRVAVRIVRAEMAARRASRASSQQEDS